MSNVWKVRNFYYKVEHDALWMLVFYQDGIDAEMAKEKCENYAFSQR